MGIETDLNRIATSMEEIVKHLKGTPVSLGNPGKTTGAPKAAAATPKNAPAPAPAPAVDPITGEPEAEITQDQVHKRLQDYMDKFGVEGKDGVKLFIISHGGNAAKPTISSIPAANYKKIMSDIDAALKGKLWR